MYSYDEVFGEKVAQIQENKRRIFLLFRHTYTNDLNNINFHTHMYLYPKILKLISTSETSTSAFLLDQFLKNDTNG